MPEEPSQEIPINVSNERAVAWVRQIVVNKRAEQKRVVEEYKTNYKL